MTRLGAVVRWRLATTVVSLRLVPPGLVLVGVLVGVLSQRPQLLGGVVAVDAVILFGLAVWIGLVHASALSPGHRAVTQVTVGLTRAHLGELLAGAVLVAGTAAVLLAWPVAVGAVDRPGLVVALACHAVIVTAGLAGLATALVVDALGVRAPVRFVAALALVALALARPALAEGRPALGAVSTVVAPAVLDVARAANAEPPGMGAAAAACLVWAAGASSLAWWLRSRRAPPERSA